MLQSVFDWRVSVVACEGWNSRVYVNFRGIDGSWPYMFLPQDGSLIALGKARSDVIVSRHCSMDASAAPGFAWQRSFLS